MSFGERFATSALGGLGETLGTLVWALIVYSLAHLFAEWADWEIDGHSLAFCSLLFTLFWQRYSSCWKELSCGSEAVDA